MLIGAIENYTMLQTAWATLTAAIGTVALTAGLEGWFLKKANIAERALLIATAPLFLHTGMLTDGIAFAVLAIVIMLQLVKRITSA